MSTSELARVLNSAVVSSRVESSRERDLSAELRDLMQTPAFKAILAAIRQLSITEGLSDKEACEQVLKTFRKLDRIWDNYVFLEGVDRLRG